MWGDGDPEGVRRRAAEEMKATARAARRLGVDTVVGFTGSKIWKTVAMFPPVPQSMVDDGYQDFADRWNPVLDVFDEVGVRFAHEVHPSEIAYDYWTTVRAMEAIGHRPAFGLNWDPSHFVWQDLDPVGFLWDFRDRIYHVDCKDAKRQVGNGRNGRMGSHLAWADPRRGWDFVSTGHGDVPWEACFRMLNTIGYDGPISIEWEDAGMDRLVGAPEALDVRPPARLRPARGRVRRRLLLGRLASSRGPRWPGDGGPRRRHAASRARWPSSSRPPSLLVAGCTGDGDVRPKRAPIDDHVGRRPRRTIRGAASAHRAAGARSTSSGCAGPPATAASAAAASRCRSTTPGRTAGPSSWRSSGCPRRGDGAAPFAGPQPRRPGRLRRRLRARRGLGGQPATSAGATTSSASTRAACGAAPR